MTTDVLPQLALGSAQALRQVLDLLSSVRLETAVVEAMLRQSLLGLDFIRTNRDRLAAQLAARGMEARVFRDACRRPVEALDVLADVHRRLLAMPLEKPQQEEIRRQEGLAAEVHRSFAEWLEFIDRPQPPIDAPRLQQGLDEAARGELVRVDGYEDLFGEPPPA